MLADTMTGPLESDAIASSSLEKPAAQLPQRDEDYYIEDSFMVFQVSDQRFIIHFSIHFYLIIA